MIEQLQSKQPVTNGLLKRLYPFLDNKGVLRSRSRLENFLWMPYSTRFPAILIAKHCHFTRLRISSTHLKFGHTFNYDTVKSKMQDSLYIIGLDNELRSVRQTCYPCERARNLVSAQQQMSALPAWRLS